MKITVIGTGYVGLVTGTCFSETGSNVTCVDIDEKKIETLKKGEIPFYEPGLSELVIRNQQDGRLTFSSDLRGAVTGSDVAFICVGTPSRKDGSANLDFVFQAAREIAYAADDIVVNLQGDEPSMPAAIVRQVATALAAQRSAAIATAASPLRSH